jgi:hypothetical protein
MHHLFGYLIIASYVCVMITSHIPPEAQQLLSHQSAIEVKLSELEAIINKAERGPMGMTIDAAKTPEWKEAKHMHSIYWAAYREVNAKLSKIRKAVGYEAINGKRVTVYQYK